MSSSSSLSASGPQFQKYTRVANEILPRLFLGDIQIALNKDELTRLGITDMITVESKQLPAHDIAPCVKRYLYLNAMDHPKQDLISHFETSNEFIETALKNPSNKVYVHCVAGISRSATLIIAYIMKSRCMSYNEAHELVVQKRKIVDPNQGFVCQLTLYHSMKYTINIGNLDYRHLVLEYLVFQNRLLNMAFYVEPGRGQRLANVEPILSTKSVNHNIDRASMGAMFDQYFNKLHLQEVNKYPEIYDQKRAYRCNKCRVVVFYPISLIENRPPNRHKTPDAFEKLLSKYTQAKTTDSSSGPSASSSWFSGSGKQGKGSDKVCSFYFVEPQPWMSSMIMERDGLLLCYKCGRKLGKYDWSSSDSCNCEIHDSRLNMNLFKLYRRKIDFGPVK